MASAPSLHLPGNITPSVPRSDTSYASEPFNYTSSPPSSNRTSDRGQDFGLPIIPSVSGRPRTETNLSISSTSSVTSLRRKPLPATAYPLPPRVSSAAHLHAAAKLQLPEQPFARPFSIDSPTLHEFPPTLNSVSPARNVDLNSSKPTLERLTVTADPSAQQSSRTIETSGYLTSPSSKGPSLTVPQQTPSTASKQTWPVSDSALTSVSDPTSPWSSDTSSVTHTQSNMSIFSAKPTAPHNLPNVTTRTYSDETNNSDTTVQNLLSPGSRSPGPSKLGSFFSWGGNPSPASSTTTFSERPFSPLPSPHPTESTAPSLADAFFNRETPKAKPRAIDVPRANAEAGSYFGNAYLQLPLATPPSPVQVEEMEKELKEISAELAASIRREMDLEDLVERLQSEAQNTPSPGRRTSDYFSDSGTSSVRYAGEPDSKQEDLDRAIRKTELEKAQMRLELNSKVQDERTKRKQLESQIKILEEKAAQADIASINSLDANGRLRDLEATCEDLRRRLAEERQVKDNFQDLLAALKDELESSHNERDNLRDEIVPQLRARVEGLEAQAAEHEKLTYEQTKMQQELQTLKNENVSLINSQKMQIDTQTKRFSSIIEENASPKDILTRSSSLTRPRQSSLSRNSSVKVTESREALAERVKDIELQRDALHRALKSLLERQEHQNRENQKRIRQLEMERDRALSSTPKKAAYDKEVSSLREEINTLRRRAEEAIEQKWQCEKGLSGLKMDLDRAEQEIGSLRTLLQEKDILITTSSRPRSGSGVVSSESLERAYRDLQVAYAESLERIKNLELSGKKDVETEEALKMLEKSLADAISERQFAKQEGEFMRQQNNSLRESEQARDSHEAALADELRDSAKRVEDLATQVRQQLATNATLRQRLSDTISRGEKEQKANAQKIMFLQSKLKSLEDQLMAAQNSSEERIQRHEDDVRELKEAHNVQLQRMKDSLRSPRAFSGNSPVEPFFANTSKSPRVSNTTSGQAMSMSQESQMNVLKQRVVELEAALAEADRQMEEVVGRMNVAQIEVMELQNEREEAVRETKRLQKAIEQEKVKTFEGRFATLSS